MKRIFLLLLIAFASLQHAAAQEYLSLDRAIARALANNYDVRIADVTAQVAGTNNTIGNAGLLPTVSGTGSVNQGISNTRLVRTEGTVTERAGSSKIEANVPATDITFTLPTWSQTGEDAGTSRRLGGIHFATGDVNGRALGRQVATYVYAKANQYINGQTAG